MSKYVNLINEPMVEGIVPMKTTNYNFKNGTVNRMYHPDNYKVSTMNSNQSISLQQKEWNLNNSIHNIAIITAQILLEPIKELLFTSNVTKLVNDPIADGIEPKWNT